MTRVFPGTPHRVPNIECVYVARNEYRLRVFLPTGRSSYREHSTTVEGAKLLQILYAWHHDPLTTAEYEFGWKPPGREVKPRLSLANLFGRKA